MISCTGGVARRVMPPVLGSKCQFRSALEPYRTGARFRLARPFPFKKLVRKLFLIFLFLVHRQESINRNSTIQSVVLFSGFVSNKSQPTAVRVSLSCVRRADAV